MMAISDERLRMETGVLREGPLSAEYNVVRSAATGDWVAVGSVREDDRPCLSPAWLLVGTGASEAEAVEDLRRRLQAACQRLRNL